MRIPVLADNKELDLTDDEYLALKHATGATATVGVLVEPVKKEESEEGEPMSPWHQTPPCTVDPVKVEEIELEEERKLLIGRGLTNEEVDKYQEYCKPMPLPSYTAQEFNERYFMKMEDHDAPPPYAAKVVKTTEEPMLPPPPADLVIQPLNAAEVASDVAHVMADSMTQVHTDLSSTTAIPHETNAGNSSLRVQLKASTDALYYFS